MDPLTPSRNRLREAAKWARIAYDLDQDFGPVTHQPVPMQDGESVAEWRTRNRASIEAHLQGWDWAQHREYWS